jgi:guanyl-specific ribonuclease Sa
MGGRTIAPLTARVLLVLLLGVLGLSLAPERADARSHHRHHGDPSATSQEAGSASLHDPAERIEIKKMLDRIAANGPFRHRQDGVVFGNREGYLPARPRGYYHEYTVETPGSADRGARRLIRGGGGELYYTHDHYRSFERIDPEALR